MSNVLNKLRLKLFVLSIDNLVDLPPPEAIILTFLAVAISHLLL
ncbi:hypothetical protein [Hydrocoleum sp. CS-953]|nr:hypothetical protein [Hydrocoleum sp. CS-953]